MTQIVCVCLSRLSNDKEAFEKRICFNLFSQDQATQTLADQRCNLLIRENEKLMTQLTTVREALARCQGKNKNLKRNGEAKINESACDLSRISLIFNKSYYLTKL